MADFFSKVLAASTVETTVDFNELENYSNHYFQIKKLLILFKYHNTIFVKYSKCGFYYFVTYLFK